MTAQIPHYRLFSESTANRCARTGSEAEVWAGRWRIVLEAADGSSTLEAWDEEELPPDRLELLAVIRGLEAIPQPARVTLVTGSHYVSRGLRFGLSEWRQNGWQWERFGELSQVANADLWQRLDHALGIHEVQCRSVRVDQPHAEAFAVRRPSNNKPGSRWARVSERWNGWLTLLTSWCGRRRQSATRWCAT